MEKLIEKLKLELEELANTEPVDLDEVDIRLNILANYEFMDTMQQVKKGIDTMQDNMSSFDMDKFTEQMEKIKNYGK